MKAREKETLVHPTARIHSGARVGKGVKIGAYTIIGENVEIGDGTEVGSHCVIEGPAKIGRDNRIFPGVVLGMEPQDLSYRGEDTRLVIGDNNIIREYATIHRGTAATGETRVGSNNYLMAYTHIAHDCHVGSYIIIANGTGLSGHVTVEDRAVISGLVGVHQFVRIGKMAMVGGCSKVTQDVPPFLMVDGHPAEVRGLNVVGMRRNGVDSEVRRGLKRMYRLIFKQGINLSRALQKIEEEMAFELEASKELAHFINFIRSSERGICRG